MMIKSDIIDIFKQNFTPVYRLLKSSCKKNSDFSFVGSAIYPLSDKKITFLRECLH